MSASMRRSLPLLAGLAALLAGSCGRRGEPVATMIEAQGAVERNDGAGAWTGVAPGFMFVVGDVLKTGSPAQARLRLTNGTVIRVLDNARIRFARGTLPAAKGPDVNVELGSAEVETATADVALVTALGVARVERGARLRVSSDGVRSTLEVVVGRAVLLASEGEVVVEQGNGARSADGGRPEIYRVVVGAPIVEASPPPAPTAPAAPEPAPPPPPAPSPAPAPAVPLDDQTRAQSSRADVTLAAGDSGIVHVAGSALALRLAFNDVCGGEASLELKGQGPRAVTGRGAVVLKLRPGTLRYALRCTGDGRGAKPRASGSLAIKRDSGNAPVSRRPPVNALDADGRRYTVLFQTRLPALTLGWAGAPTGATDLSLHVEPASSSGVQTFPAGGASQRLASGALAEGSYVWWFATTDGRTSPKTTVTIRFDNAAPTAQFFPSKPGGNTAPGVVAVDGVTIDGAKVSAGGRSLTIDDRGRFQAAVAPLPGDDAVVVRLEHPRTGIHYYVRQAGSRRHGRLAHAR
jgi:hypothetical protein